MTCRVLVTDSLADEGLDIFRAEPTIALDVRVGLKPGELCRILPSYQALVVRSGTKVTGETLAAADSLRVIGRAGIGVDNIDVDAATRRGIVVMNTPGGNNVTTAEYDSRLYASITWGPNLKSIVMGDVSGLVDGMG